MPSSTSESRRAPPEAEGTDSPNRRAHPYDSNVRWMVIFPKSQREIMRLTLDPVVYDELDPDFELQLLPTRVEGGDGLVDEADAGLLAQHRDGRSVVNVLEHKSDNTKFAQLQVVSSAIRLTRQLVETGKTNGGEMPITNAVVALNGKASGSCPKSLSELAKLSDEEKAVTLTVSGVVVFDFSKVCLENLTKDPHAGMSILLQKFGPHGPRPTDEEIAYMARGLKGCTKDQKQYALHTLVNELDVPAGKLREEMAKVAEPEEVKATMDMSNEMLRAEGRSKMFLRAAERLFQIVPDHRAEQVRNASEEQVNEWFDRLFDASDLESVFDGSGGNGPAVNGVPAR